MGSETVRALVQISSRPFRLRERLADVRRDSGAAATEYAMLIGFIAVVVAAGIIAFGGALQDVYEWLATRISGPFG